MKSNLGCLKMTVVSFQNSSRYAQILLTLSSSRPKEGLWPCINSSRVEKTLAAGGVLAMSKGLSNNSESDIVSIPV